MEIQITNDHCAKRTNISAISRCATRPIKNRFGEKSGEWNKMKIIANGKNIIVELNGKKVTDMDMRLWTSGKINPEGSEIPSWLPKPFAELPTKGYIGFQGKQSDVTIWFRNIKIKEI